MRRHAPLRFRVSDPEFFFFSGRQIRVKCAEAVEWTLDGEREPETDHVLLENLHSAVRIIIPKDGQSVPFEYTDEEAEL